MTEMILKILVEVLAILAIATRETKQGRQSESIHSNWSSRFDVPLEKYMKKLVRKKDIEDALKRLDRLTQEEARLAAAEALKFTHDINDKAKVLINGVQMG